jgi:hypothetical protein
MADRLTSPRTRIAVFFAALTLTFAASAAVGAALGPQPPDDGPVQHGGEDRGDHP